ncbi:hypothetical protein WG66_015127 [Moniliophthora roreri]|nr:hypothetical protein WG66_015127 [Moniliophthora roreri]
MNTPHSRHESNSNRRPSHNSDRSQTSEYFTSQSTSNSAPVYRRADSDLENAGVSAASTESRNNDQFSRLSDIVPGVAQMLDPDDHLRKGSDTTFVENERRGKLKKKLSFASLASGLSHAPFISSLARVRRPSAIVQNVEDVTQRRKFLLKLAKALLTFGAPSHRVQSQLSAASRILGADAEFVHLPNIIIASFRTGNNSPSRTYFVRVTGRVALTSLHQVHQIYKDVLHDRMGAETGTQELRRLLREHPIYPLYARCILAFFSASVICTLSFGGSFYDMWISGACACVLQYLGLSAANKSALYANVYEVSVSIIVAFVARALSNVPGNIFCYSAISSAGVVLILPGYTVLVSALELMSKNIFCGSVRIVYAIIYTLFLGFGLTIGSDFYLVVDRRARKAYYSGNKFTNLTYVHGHFQFTNGSNSSSVFPHGVLGYGSPLTYEQQHIVKGCFRDPSWHWMKQPFPWWTVFFLVPIYSTSSSLSNLQRIRSRELPIMVAFSCVSYAANRAASIVLPGRTDLISAAGAFVIGLLGNLYSRIFEGTAFTSMVTGVLFLVPSGIAQGGGVTQNFHSSAEQYQTGFALALRMLSVASGVAIGLFVSQVLVYLFGTRKNAAHFAF